MTWYEKGNKDRNQGKNPSSAISEANMDIGERGIKMLWQGPSKHTGSSVHYGDTAAATIGYEWGNQTAKKVYEES